MTPPVYIVRHGQTDWNAENRVQGQVETAINMLGRRQAQSNGRRLAKLIPDTDGYAFVASPMLRTRQTMEIIRGEMGLPRDGYEMDPRLMEINFGDWQGSTFPELEKNEPGITAEREADKWNFRPPGAAAESYHMLADRIRPWVRSFRGPALVVTHGGVIRALFNILNGMEGHDAAMLMVPQDRVLLLEEWRVSWV